MNNETLKRDLMRFISTTNSAGGGARGAIGRNQVTYQPTASSRQSSLDRNENSPATGRSVGFQDGGFLFSEDLNNLRRDIVSSVRAELQEIFREMGGGTRGGGTRVSRGVRQAAPGESPGNPSPASSLVPQSGSDLYETHLYTQL